jgi:hypothetical protein
MFPPLQQACQTIKANFAQNSYSAKSCITVLQRILYLLTYNLLSKIS